MKRTLLFILIATLIASSTYLIGLKQGINRAVVGSNTASLLFFTGIHQDLKSGNIQNATKTCETAIGTHIAVVQASKEHPQAALYFLLPWIGDPLSGSSDRILGGMNRYLKNYPNAVPSETTAFLDRYQK